MNKAYRRLPSLASACVLVFGLACSGADEPATEETAQAGASPATEVSGSATIFAAASLTESFEDLETRFEKEHRGAAVAVNLGPSSGLAAQIIEQGGADAFASADDVNMKKVSDKGLVSSEPVVFIKNRLEIIVAPGNPKGIKTLADLAKADLKVVLAAPQVPVGRYAREALTKSGVTVKAVSDALDVKGVVGPVTLGEADAGIVYSTDVRAAGDKAAGVAIPQGRNVLASYLIALTRDGADNVVARAFLDLVLSDGGERTLTGNGFMAK